MRAHEIRDVPEDNGRNQTYEAVALIVGVQRLMTAPDHEADFKPHVVQLRAAHKPKCDLMKLFDEQCW